MSKSEVRDAASKFLARCSLFNIVTVRGNFGFLWSCSHSFYVKALYDSQGLDERWTHENAGVPPARCRGQHIFVSPFSLRAFLFGDAKRNADKY
jgi:hypothetical protein